MNSSSLIRTSTALLLVVSCTAFAPIQKSDAQRRQTSLSMAPKFDKSSGKWFTDDPMEMDGSSYGPIGSLYRAGPKPL